jgi:hypothetical protein
LELPKLYSSTELHHVVGFCLQPLAKRTGMKAVLLVLVLGVVGLPVQAQSAPNPASSQQSHYAPALTQKIRELTCRGRATWDMQKPVALLPGATHEWDIVPLSHKDSAGMANLLQMVPLINIIAFGEITIGSKWH